MIFGKRTERHQTRKVEDLEKVDESGESDDGRPKASGDQDARVERLASEDEEKPKRKGHGRRVASTYSGARIVIRQLPFADCRKPIDRRTEIDRLTGEQNPKLRNQLNH